MSLAQLPASTVKLITSSQIITSVSSAVKELFENALDAGATSIDVKLMNFGLDRLEVKDNGSGISKENTQCMALPHYTSKLSDFNDLESLETYGFRGEALNALCSVGQVSIITATSSDPMAMVYTLDSSGNISGTKPSPHVQGTTVVVAQLFKNLPVRRQFMGTSRKAQEELKQVEMVVKSLAVIKPNIRVALFHNKCMIWQKTPCATLQNSFSQLVGYSSFQHLEHLTLKTCEASIEMLVPKRDCDITVVTKSTPNFSLVFVNTRPVTYKKVVKILHQELIKKFGDNFSSRKFAVSLISINSNPSNLDVNLEPNKTKVLLKDEDEILNGMEKCLHDYYSIVTFVQEASPVLVEPVKEKECLPRSPFKEVHEECSRKRIKLDDQPSDMECGKVNDVSLNSNEILPQTPSKTEYCKTIFCAPRKEGKEEESNVLPCSGNDLLHSVDLRNQTANTTNSFLQDKEVGSNILSCSEIDFQAVVMKDQTVDTTDRISPPQSENTSHVFLGSAECERSVAPQTNCLHFSPPQTNGINENVTSNHAIRPENGSVSDGKNVHGKQASDSGLENLWDDINEKELTDLGCLDDFAISTSTQNEIGNCPSADLIGSEAWSMGHVGVGTGELVKGSSVLAGRPSVPSFGRLEKPSSSLQDDNFTSDPPQEVSNKSPKSVKAQKSPRGYDIMGSSPRMDCSVSSQMGRRELAAFTKFAREIRPQIILENPGISFTNVASTLAQKWQSLSAMEKEHYEELARQTATSKKVWKTQDKQKKMDWVTKLPEKREKTRLSIKKDRPVRKEVSSRINMDDIKMNLQTAALSIKWQENSTIRLIGQLEPSGTWICVQNSDIIVLNHSRLQEVVVNHRLLCTHGIVAKPLNPWQRLDQVCLGEEAWKMLVSLPLTQEPFNGSKIISADFIVKNGFRIEVRGDQAAFLTAVPEVLNYCGVKELRETLELSRLYCDLQECRPLCIVTHIKGEAMRICRKAPPMLQRTMVQELLDYWIKHSEALGDNCPHSKPILTRFYNLAGKTQIPL